MIAMKGRLSLSLFWFGIVFLVTMLRRGAEGLSLEKRSAAPERSSDDYPDYQLGVKYDEYPMIVPKKRGAILIDRLMVALQKAIEEEEEAARAEAENGIRKNYSLRPEDAVRTNDLQRRGHGSLAGQQKGRIYWRCYFNAVTCF